MNRNIRIFISIGILVLAAAVGSVWIRGLPEKEPIRIGAIVALSSAQGPVREGVGIYEGMLLATEEVNSRGGVNGRKIELIVKDSLRNPEAGKEAWNTIESAHQPLLYIVTHSSVATALAPLAEEQKVVLFATLATDPRITKKRDWVFRYWPTAKDEVPLIVAITKEVLHVDDLGILYLDDEFGRSVFSLLKEEFEKTGGVTVAEPFEVGLSDFRTKIVQLEDSDAIFAVGFPDHLENIFTQLKEGGFDGFTLSTNGPAAPYLRIQPAFEGVYVTTPLTYKQDFLPAQEVKEKYETQFAKPFNHYVASGYAMIRLLGDLLEDEEVSRESVKTLLEAGFIQPGVFGTVDGRPGEHDFSFPLQAAQIVDGEVEYRY